MFTDGSALGSPGPTGSATVTKNQGLNSVPIKRAKAIPSRGTSFEGELKSYLYGN